MATSDLLLGQRETFTFLVAVFRSNRRVEILFKKLRYIFCLTNY